MADKERLVSDQSKNRQTEEGCLHAANAWQTTKRFNLYSKKDEFFL